MFNRLRHWLVLFALVMRVAIPSGFMITPVAAPASAPVFVPCDGHGSLFGTAHDPRHRHPGQSGPANHSECPYSSATGAADLPGSLPSAPVIDFLRAMHGGAPSVDAFSPSPAASPPPATGPPGLIA